ncbi:MAG: SUMF1/EgtB/PvdO family nonheme iron enzyme [Fuerstiella sp.]
MPEITAHPCRDQLSAYNLGQLPPDEAVAVERHISECEPCCDTIISLSSDDTFVGLLKEARQLPTDQTVDRSVATESASCQDVPVQLAEHSRYEILGLIGKGGMGDVYQARHRKMERTVALKVINRGLIRKAEAIDRFHREVKAAAQLSHSNIVTAYDADHAGDFHFMVMEFVDGVDLSQTVKVRGALPIAEASDYVRQAAIGLQHAHERGMVHRDIKPHNLMVTADGTVKILDFGLASLAPEASEANDSDPARSDLTAAGAIMGTPDFISPEQAKDARQVDIRSDIYSLGATFYYLLSGRVPFDDGSVMHKLKSHAQIEPESLATLRDDMPEELLAIVTRMMAKNPDERYLTPSEVANALEEFLRTWQPVADVQQELVPSDSGSSANNGGQHAAAGDMSPNWLALIAKLLFYLSLVPVAFFCLDLFVFSGDTSVADSDLTLYYLVASVVLSSIAGVLTGVQQFQTSNRDDQRNFKMTIGQTVIIATILIGSAVSYFAQTNTGVVHLEVSPPEDKMTLGTHPLTIVDTSGEKPLGGTASTHQDDASGITTHSFKSANGRYNITLVDKVLTVNGERYTLENPTDAIRIVDDRVEITQVTALLDRSVAKGADSNKAGQQRSDNQLEMPLCWCPAGEFKMGREQQPVTLTRGFWMGKYEVTQAQYEALIGDNPSENKGESLPVEKVAWNEAKKFCQKFTELERKAGRLPKGWEYRLPTEAQWEYACRAGTTLVWDDDKDLVYPSTFGNDLIELGDYAWYSENSDGTPHAVGQKKPNAWGLCDMYGNVREWVRDAWQSKLSGGKDPEVDVWSPVHTCRGGDWLSPAEPCGSPFNRGIEVAGREAHMMGFRVALVPVVESDDGVAAEGDLKLLQGNWVSVSVTEGGKQLATQNGFSGLLLQIKGDTFVIAERKPDGEKTEVDTGRIEINSTVTPKTIDFIGRAERRLGIYELNHGVLRVCLVEHGGIESPRGGRIPDGNSIKRPGTFESPTGSNMMLMEFQSAKSDESLTRQSVEPSFSYDLSQVPNDIWEIYGYRPRQFRKDGRFKRILESLDQSAPNKFLMDQNLEQVLNLQWENDDRTYSQPLVVLTVIDGTAMEFASRHLGVRIDGANSEMTQSKYFPIEQGKFFPMPAEQFVRFVDDKTLILSSREFLDAHQIALKKQPNTKLLKIAASMPDALLWVISNTSDKDYVEQVKFRYSQSPLAAVLMTQLPIWEDTNYLTLSLAVGEDPNLQLAAHAPAAELQYEITQTVRTLPVTLANLLRPFGDGSGPTDAKTIDALISALGEAQVTEPSGTESRLTIPLKAAEPHLLRLLNSWFVDLEQAKSAAYKAASVNNLRQIGLAFQFFEQEHGYLPSVTTKLPGAKHPVSWRVAILKYLDEKLYNQYNLSEPWDSETNKKLLEELPIFYRHPGQEKGISNTCYITLVGDNTATGDGKAPVNLFEDISDGPQQTILVTEGFTHIPWTKPEDQKFEDEPTLPPVHPHPDGWNVIFADGATHFVSSETPIDALRALITRDGGEMVETANGVWKKVSEPKDDKTRMPLLAPTYLKRG